MDCGTGNTGGNSSSCGDGAHSKRKLEAPQMTTKTMVTINSQPKVRRRGSSAEKDAYSMKRSLSDDRM
jgi:hypothetical protein